VIAVGRLFRARGNRGELTGEIYSSQPGRAEKLKEVVLELAGGETRPSKIEEIWWHSGRPVFKGVYQDNDPAKRLVMIVNYNTDISQFWEWSGRGLRPVDDTNEAYKLGVNYVVYGLTH
jgi:hypothetical protein